MKLSSKLLRHEPCPECRKQGRDRDGNNLARWEDGHAYCFSCTYREGGNSLNLDAMANYHKDWQDEANTTKGDIRLPADYKRWIPSNPLMWLKKYDLTDAEIDFHKFGWSESTERLVAPVYGDDSELLMWQGRRFPSALVPEPRYFTQGFPERVYHILGDNGTDTLCLTEDLVSSIKVSRVMPAMPLWGSIISTKRLVVLGDLFKRLVFWLDNDKQMYTLRRQVYAAPFMIDGVQTVLSDHDPKVYSTKEIYDFLKPVNPHLR